VRRSRTRPLRVAPSRECARPRRPSTAPSRTSRMPPPATAGTHARTRAWPTRWRYACSSPTARRARSIRGPCARARGPPRSIRRSPTRTRRSGTWPYPLAATVRMTLGRVHLARGEPVRAVVLLQSALELNPRLAYAHQQLGHAYRREGRGAEARAAFARAAAAAGGAAGSAQLAYASGVTGDRTEAQAVCAPCSSRRSAATSRPSAWRWRTPGPGTRTPRSAGSTGRSRSVRRSRTGWRSRRGSRHCTATDAGRACCAASSRPVDASIASLSGADHWCHGQQNWGVNRYSHIAIPPATGRRILRDHSTSDGSGRRRGARPVEEGSRYRPQASRGVLPGGTP
jgi:hypothetical protein